MAVNINIPSQVSQTITNGVTDKAPSEDAVHDALALKANSADLGATAFSNDYNDLDNLPSIPAAQIQSDWNQSNNAALDFIKNKPTIPSTSGFVPYTGANNDVDLGTYNITADHINLNVSPSGAGFVVGSTQWNNTLGSSETLLKGGNVTLKNGVDLVARIVNKVTPNTTLTKAAYQAVRVSGAQGGRLAVALAQANNDNNSADTIGLVTETIATNQEGFIITVGQIENINTTGSLQGETWVDGDVLYLSPTVAGRLTNIKPTGAGHIIVIGYVEYAHANNGKIYVKIMNGWELDELHDVSITSVANNDLLQYDSASSLWKNESLSTAGIQPTLVSGTSIKTINGTTLLGSGDITVGGGITVGTTAVTSGTVGRIFFQGTGNVVQQSVSLFWDNTNSRLGIGATPSTTVRLDVRAQGALSTDIAFRVRNSADTGNHITVYGNDNVSIGRNGSASAVLFVRSADAAAHDVFNLQNGLYGDPLFRVRDNSTGSQSTTCSFFMNGRIYGGNNTTKGTEFDLGGYGLGASYGDNANNSVWLNNQGNVGDGTGSSVISVSSNFYINRQTVKVFKFIPNVGNFGVNVMTFGTSATNTIAIANGVAPTTSPADAFQQYSSDITAGNAAPHFRTENGNIIKLYQQSSSGITTVAQLVTVLQNLGLLS
jgi:nitrogen fixation protein